MLGYGSVGSTLAGALLDAGHEVILAINPDNPDGAAAARREKGLRRATVASPEVALVGVDLAVLAVPVPALSTVLGSLGDALQGCILIDATNPVGPGLTHATPGISGAAAVSDLAPGAAVVKTLNIYGYEHLGPVDERDGSPRPAMPLAGDDPEAKRVVAGLLRGLGWDPVDVGGIDAAIDLEHLALLWIRMVRRHGHDPGMLWARIHRGAPRR